MIRVYSTPFTIPFTDIVLVEALTTFEIGTDILMVAGYMVLSLPYMYRSVDTGMRINRFASDEPPAIELLRIDAEVEQRQIERVQAVRARRDASAHAAAIEAVKAAARGSDNLVPVIVEAVEALATVGEVADAMRDVFGEHTEIDV
jgi:methylmalonyl-CoA mutase N-terminal domain/subunit